MSALPKELKMGTIKYKILSIKGLRDSDGKPADGLCTDSIKIELDTEQSYLGMKQTLFHEIIHAIGYYGDLKALDNEHLVHLLSQLLYDALATNPQVLKYIFDGVI